MAKYTPIYTKDGHSFIVPSESQIGADEHESFKIAMGTIVFDGALLGGFKWSGKHLALDEDGKVTVKGTWADLGCWRVVILETEPGRTGAEEG